MSENDSFIEEVTEEVRRDRLYTLGRRYGWIAALAVVGVVTLVGVWEWRQARTVQAARATGDAIIAALNIDESVRQATALAQVPAQGSGAVVADFLRAAALSEAGEAAQAAALLSSVAARSDLPLIYRQVARFKLLLIPSGELSRDERRAGLRDLAGANGLIAPLAQEQLALLEVEAGDKSAAIAQFQSLLENAQTPREVRQRAAQMIFALGGVPNLDGLI